jgi:hypothetical protein
MYYEKRGARDRHRYGVDGVVIGSEDEGNCSGGVKEGTLDVCNSQPYGARRNYAM